MRQPFFEDLMTAMYPSGLLHTFGVNGKISGSVGAVGEMQEVLPLLHSPRGCGFHYRYSAPVSYTHLTLPTTPYV